MPFFLTLQPWLNVAGLALDFLGVVLLAFEWRVALAAERREAEIAEREERFRPRPTMPQRPHAEVFDDMDRRRKFQERMMRSRSAWQARRGWFTLAMALVALGFLLQIAGSLPLETF